MENQVGKISFAQNAVIILFILAGVALAVHDFRGRDLAAKAPDIPETTATDLDRLIPPIPLPLTSNQEKFASGKGSTTIPACRTTTRFPAPHAMT